jgi:hypothetical protein
MHDGVGGSDERRRCGEYDGQQCNAHDASP